MTLKLLAKGYQVARAIVTRQVAFECDRIPYHFKHLPLKKLLNWVATESSVYAKPERPWGWPTLLQVEPSAHCNLSCALCPQSTGLGRPSGHMSFDLFKKVIDEVGAYVFLILMWDWGEPFLNPEIYGMISYAHQKGIRLASSSNGHVLAQPGRAEQVVRSGLDTLIFAIDGISQETYSRYRRTGDLETALEGLRAVVAQKRLLGSTTPRVNLRFIVMRHNEHEIPKVKEMASSLGVDVLSFKTLNPDCDPRTGLDREEFVPVDIRYRRFRYADDGQRLRVSQNPCRNLWNTAAIHWNGVVCPCTFDAREQYILGDLSQESFAAVWRGERYRRLRQSFRARWHEIDICRDCSYAFAGGDLAGETIAEALFYRGPGSEAPRR